MNNTKIINYKNGKPNLTDHELLQELASRIINGRIKFDQNDNNAIVGLRYFDGITWKWCDFAEVLTKLAQREKEKVQELTKLLANFFSPPEY